MVVERDRHDKYLSHFLAGFFLQIEIALCLNRRTEQTELQLFFNESRARPRSSRKEETVRPFLDGERGIRLQRLQVGEVLFPAVDLVGPEAVHEVREDLDVEQIQAGAVNEGGKSQ